MSAFTEFTDYKKVPNTYKKYVTTQTTFWELGKKGSGYRFVLPVNTTFDISVPFFLEWFLSPHDEKFLPCALLHDELLKRGYDSTFSSAEMRRASIARGISKAKAWTIFLATIIWNEIKNK